MQDQHTSLEAIQDIRRMMDRSSRFISLSGLSGVSAGVFALAGSYWAGRTLDDYYINHFGVSGYQGEVFTELKWKLLMIGMIVLALALVTSYYFTWRKVRADRETLWNPTSRRLIINMMIPLVAGGVLVLTMLQYDEWRFVAPSCLVFYGIALVNGSKYTLGEIRYLGLLEIVLGLVCAQPYFVGYGLYFWAMGFGWLHILYGVIMWIRYERKGIKS